ncbi:MAG: tail fiber protein [Paracoccaceae bacterium]
MKHLSRHAAALALAAGVFAAAETAEAQGQECFIGEIRMFGGDFAPRNWALMDGQLLPISQNTALFSILGATYGGDGRSTFGLPDMRGRVPMHAGSGPGLSQRRLGQMVGSEQNTITAQQMPSHTHSLRAVAAAADQSAPGGRVLANDGNDRIYHDGPADADMHPSAIGMAGGGQPLNNIQPVQVVNHIICLFGTFPSRS